MPSSVAARSAVWVCGRSLAGNAGSAIGRSLVQRNPTECGGSLCAISKPPSGPRPTRAVEPRKKKVLIKENIMISNVGCADSSWP